MKHGISIFLLLAISLTGCQTMSRQEKRIEKNPALYDRLGSAHRERVQRGEVTEGMSRDAVFLSWGRPDAVRAGSREGKGKETWLYFGTRPVQTTHFSMGTGGYHHFYNHFGCHPTYGYGFGQTVDYIPEVDRSVEFVNDRVVAWERRR